jgi:hypothetical protein
MPSSSHIGANDPSLLLGNPHDAPAVLTNLVYGHLDNAGLLPQSEIQLLLGVSCDLSCTVF